MIVDYSKFLLTIALILFSGDSRACRKDLIWFFWVVSYDVANLCITLDMFLNIVRSSTEPDVENSLEIFFY